MEVECPKCQKINRVSFGTLEVSCGECKESFKETRFSFSKKNRSLNAAAITTAILMASGAATHKYIIDDKRYPLESEYAMINICMGRRPIFENNLFTRKLRYCACIVKEAENEHRFQDLIRKLDEDDQYLENFTNRCPGK